MVHFESIGLMFQMEILSQQDNYSIECRRDLLDIVHKISSLKIESNPIKAVKRIKQYKILESELLFKFKEFGGNMDLMNKRLREYENNSIPFVNEFNTGLSKIKNMLKVK